MTSRLVLRYKKNLWRDGDTVPETGLVVDKAKSLFSILDFVSGKFHTDTSMQILGFEDGQKAKAIFDHRDPGADGLFRTQRAAAQLELLAQGIIVPRVLYSKGRSLIVEFIEGTPLNRDLLTPELAEALAMYTAAAQLAGVMAPRPMREVVKSLSAELSAGSGLRNFVLEFLEGPLSSIETVRYGVCFADSALKNYVCKSDGSLVFVDVLGLGEKPLGSMFVKQMLWLPQQFREPYWDGYLKGSPQGAEIVDDLWAHTVLHFAERAVFRSPDRVTQTAFRETRHRKRQRLKAFDQAMERLKQCSTHVPRDSVGCAAWLFSLSDTT